MDVCYASNEAYVPYLGVSMFSLIANNLSEGPLHVHVIANGISQEGCRRLQENAALACRAAGREHASGFQLSFYQLSGLSRRLGGTIDTGSYDISMLGRFFIGELLPETVERVLYLDCDTLVEKSLWPLFQRKAPEAGTEEPEGPALWGVMEPTIYPSILKQLEIPEKTGFYINSGVLMVDLVKWRKHQAGERLLRFYRENGERLFCGDQDAINHVMEQYFTHASNSVADGFCETLVKTLMKYAPVALEKPDDYEARAEIMYACTFGCNGLLALGTAGSPWPMHGIEHALSAYYDITHGEGLAIITPHWMRHVLNERTQERFVKFGLNVFGLSADMVPAEIAEQTIVCTSQFFKSLGMPMTLREVGIDDSRLEEMAHHVAVNEGLDAPGTFAPLNEQDILSILKAAL